VKENRLELDGIWTFLHVPNDSVSPAEVRSITVPGVWQAQFADLRTQAGIGIYHRRFTLSRDWLHDRLFIRFRAVFHHARVWINEHYVGEHEGGFLPFSFDVTHWVREGSNEILVRVESPTDDPEQFESPFAEIPFGKQSWYGPLSGIWQSVWLEQRAADHIAHTAILSDARTGEVSVQVRFAAALSIDVSLEVDIFAPGGEPVAGVSVLAKEGEDAVAAKASVAAVVKWSPEHPNLYNVRLSLMRKGHAVDVVEESFGFRTFEARGGKFYLNDEVFYLRGALDQDYYADTICTPPSVEFLEDQLLKAKQLGLNCLRCHIKAPDPRYYEVADRLGMLIWSELPNGGFSTERSRARKQRMLRGIVDRDYNHPSIICWTIINENWGVDLVHDAEHREWLRSLYSWLKTYDPSRLVVDNSPVAPSFHICTDVADYHYYAAFPDSRISWDRFVEALAGRAEWLFSPHGDALTSGEEPLVCSEFGNWGLPDPRQLAGPEGEEPWWFETGHDWGEGVMYAHGIENRFRDWSLDRVFGSLRSFVEAAQWQQFRALKYEIESMRRRPELAGYVITELTDCNWESNGLLDLQRNPRVFHDVFRNINADTVIVPVWERLSFWDDEKLSLGVAIANGPDRLPSGTLNASVGGTGPSQSCSIEPGMVTEMRLAELTLPAVEKGKVATVAFELRGADTTIIASNSLDVVVYPSRLRDQRPLQPVWSPAEELRERLGAQGYVSAETIEQADIVIATSHDDILAGYVRAGGTLLLLPETEMSLYPFFPHWQNVRVQSRTGSLWAGDWVSSFSWLRRRGEFAGLPGGPLIDATFDRVIPELVISGCNLLDFQARVHAGLVVGWIHKPVALVVERSYGKGRLVVSTFRLTGTAVDPTATMLLDALIRTATRVAPSPQELVRKLAPAMTIAKPEHASRSG
jgi:Glycosyl hydrolases family 2, sugar binding domain/Glycosyl hydrolases family 2/Glycosyl hydrolases family 2, TIM barrel domain